MPSPSPRPYRSLLTIFHVVFSRAGSVAERHALDLAEAQAAAGHEVHVVGAGTRLRRSIPARVTWHAMPFPLLRDARLDALLRKHQADVAHGHLGPACKAVSRCDGVVRVGTLHEGYEPNRHELLDGLICLNREQWNTLGAYLGAARVVHPWAPPLRPSPPGSSLRERLKLADDQVLIGTVASLTRAEGVDLLIRAFMQSAPGHAVLAILGEGRQARALKRLADRHPGIHFLESQDGAGLDAALEAMDLFVSPARDNEWSPALLQAMRAELPIVATRTRGARQLLSDEHATLVPIGDVGALSAALLARIRGLRMPIPGTRPVRERVSYELGLYERDTAVARIDSFYRSLISGGAWRPRRLTSMEPATTTAAASAQASSEPPEHSAK